MKNNNGGRRIAVDVDGVLFDFHKPFLRFYNQRHGTTFQIDDITNYLFLNIIQRSGISVEEFRIDMDDFYHTPLFKKLPLIYGARKSIRKLSQSNFLGNVTSRPDITSAITLAALSRHFPGYFKETHFTSQHGGNGYRIKKSELCLDHDYEVLVEDAAEYANECAEAGVTSFLLTRPWNEKEPLHPNVIRVKNWPEILQKLQ